ISGLGGEIGVAALEKVVPQLFFFWADGLMRNPPQSYDREWWVPRQVARSACRIWMMEKAPDYAVELAVGRLQFLLLNALSNYEVVPSWTASWLFHPPQADECESLIVGWSDRPAARAAIRELLDGDWDRPLEVPP